MKPQISKSLVCGKKAMSNMEFARGKVITLGINLCTFMKIEDEDDALDAFLDKYTVNEYIVINGIVHKTLEYEDLDPCGHTSVEKNKDGTISFVSLWYNGGACLNETIEYGLRNLK